MSCETEVIDNAKDPERCKCQGAVLKSYQGLMQAGQPESDALEAAKIVYRYHHPEDTKECAALIVERWVYAEHFH